MSEIREVLIQLRYARQKIEHIERELKKSSAIAAPGELQFKIDGVISALYTAKAILLYEKKKEAKPWEKITSL